MESGKRRHAGAYRLYKIMRDAGTARQIDRPSVTTTGSRAWRVVGQISDPTRNLVQAVQDPAAVYSMEPCSGSSRGPDRLVVPLLSLSRPTLTLRNSQQTSTQPPDQITAPRLHQVRSLSTHSTAPMLSGIFTKRLHLPCEELPCEELRLSSML